MLLECSNIAYHFPGSEALVLEGIDCALRGPGFHALFGSSGVGKSTLAGIISSEIKGFSGKIRRMDITTILYSHNLERLPGWYSIEEHLWAVTPTHRRPDIEDLLTCFGLNECRSSRFRQLSMGQRNRINLARYLLRDFDLLIMDESLANVDEATRERIIRKIKAMFPQKCFLYISHSVAEAAKFCDQILVLRGAGTTPRLISLGMPRRTATEQGAADLEQTMLEIVRAA